MSFYEDLAFGNIYEKKLVELLDNDDFKIMKGYFPFYDVEIIKEEVTTKYEVKTDRISYKNNCILIEYFCSNKPSGIFVTTADYYAYFIVKPHEVYDLYLIPVELLFKLIKNKEYINDITSKNKNSKMYVFNLDLFLEYKFINKIK